MDLDALLRHYFGTTDLETVDAPGLEHGRQRLGVDFGVERDPGRRFALWALMHSLGAAPDPASAFKDPRERDAADLYARMAGRAADR